MGRVSGPCQAQSTTLLETAAKYRFLLPYGGFAPGNSLLSHPMIWSPQICMRTRTVGKRGSTNGGDACPFTRNRRTCRVSAPVVQKFLTDASQGMRESGTCGAVVRAVDRKARDLATHSNSVPPRLCGQRQDASPVQSFRVPIYKIGEIIPSIQRYRKDPMTQYLWKHFASYKALVMHRDSEFYFLRKGYLYLSGASKV